MDTSKKSSTLRQSKDLSGSRKPYKSEKKESANLKIYLTSQGRTGNNLFQYVSALGIAHQNNRSVVFNPGMKKLKAIFPKLKYIFLMLLPIGKYLLKKNISHLILGFLICQRKT